ncbi:MAG: hypothetical protein AAF221_11695 [Pseudomonadota bacterium]
MTTLQMPSERKFGWRLKSAASSHFGIVERANGQFCVVLNHALLRGVSAKMIHWWFLHFAALKVKVCGIEGFDGAHLPAYQLWHPIDHLSAMFLGALGPGGTAKAGCKIHIREAMQYDVHGWKYPVDTALKVFYVAEDGWAMGKALPLIGPVMMLRIHFCDVYDAGVHLGAHYHYEVVIGASGNDIVSQKINKKITAQYAPEFFAAWQRHNVIEVGTFENFLAPLYEQHQRGKPLEYTPDMNAAAFPDVPQTGFDRSLFDRRLAGYRQTHQPSKYQRFDQASFL